MDGRGRLALRYVRRIAPRARHVHTSFQGRHFAVPLSTFIGRVEGDEQPPARGTPSRPKLWKPFELEAQRHLELLAGGREDELPTGRALQRRPRVSLHARLRRIGTSVHQETHKAGRVLVEALHGCTTSTLQGRERGSSEWYRSLVRWV